MNNKEAVRKHEEIIAQRSLFQSHLEELKMKLGSVLYTIIATDDGFPVAYTDMSEKEATRKAAMTASLDGLSTTVAMESGLKQADATHVECESGFIFSRTVSLDVEKRVVLLVSASREENFATIQWNIKQMVASIAEQFSA